MTQPPRTYAQITGQVEETAQDNLQESINQRAVAQPMPPVITVAVAQDDDEERLPPLVDDEPWQDATSPRKVNGRRRRDDKRAVSATLIDYFENSIWGYRAGQNTYFMFLDRKVLSENCSLLAHLTINRADVVTLQGKYRNVEEAVRRLTYHVTFEVEGRSSWKDPRWRSDRGGRWEIRYKHQGLATSSEAAAIVAEAKVRIEQLRKAIIAWHQARR